MFLARIEEIRDPHLDVIFVGQRVFPGGGGGGTSVTCRYPYLFVCITIKRNLGEEIQPLREIWARKYSLSSEKKPFCARLIITRSVRQKSTLLWCSQMWKRPPCVKCRYCEGYASPFGSADKLYLIFPLFSRTNVEFLQRKEILNIFHLILKWYQIKYLKYFRKKNKIKNNNKNNKKIK